MHNQSRRILWGILLLLVVLGAVSAFFQWHSGASRQRQVEETRRALREQGFKTDLSEFDLSLTPSMAARSKVLLDTFSVAGPMPAEPHPDLMEAAGEDRAVVVWQEDELKQDPALGFDDTRLSWDEFRGLLEADRPSLDAAREVILSGPIAFDLQAREGAAMRLPHLAAMRRLSQLLDDRTLVDIHDGQLPAAWTNLMADTRLVTAWNPEPAEVSHSFHCASVRFALQATWQALQTNGWTADQLAALQREWESVNFLKALPETAAFSRASVVAMCEQERSRGLLEGMTVGEFAREAWEHPENVPAAFTEMRRRRDYVRRGSYEDEQRLLLFFRDREVELKNAIQAPNWQAMSALPGVTNPPDFLSTNRSQTIASLQARRMRSRIMGGPSGPLAGAAVAEAERRIIITALALERYQRRYGFHPQSLAQLVPEFLTALPADFIDGQPLRYHSEANGQFQLYSIGIDGVDNGGLLPQGRQVPMGYELFASRMPGMVTQESDIVWPLPASTEMVRALRHHEDQERRRRERIQAGTLAEEEWRQSPGRLARTDKILATAWAPAARGMTVDGRPLEDYLANAAPAGTNHPTLAQLLTLKPVPTGAEPDDLAFEVPIRYEAATNDCELALVVDADPDDSEGDEGGKIQDLSRAANGNCLLVWHTIFDPAGRHAVQAQLSTESTHGGIFAGKGPAIAVTTSNLCQFSLDSATYDVDSGARFHGRLPEKNAQYSIECITTNGVHLATLSGSTTNGEFDVVWNLVDEHGGRLGGETFNSWLHLDFPDSGRKVVMRGP